MQTKWSTSGPLAPEVEGSRHEAPPTKGHCAGGLHKMKSHYHGNHNGAEDEGKVLKCRKT